MAHLSPDHLHRQAVELHQRGAVAQAARLYHQVLAVAPGHFGACQMLAVAQAQMGRPDLALALIDRALAVRPGDAETLAYRGNILAMTGRFAEALADYDRALGAAPRDASLWSNRGNALQELDRCEEALESYGRALALRPDDLDARYNRANALRRLGRRDEALAGYDAVIARRPDHADAWNNRGNTLQEMGRAGDALASHDRAVTLAPRLAALWGNRGNALRTLGRMAAAVESYDRALALEAGNAAIWSSRGIALRALQRVQEALASFDRALALAPGAAETWHQRGSLLWDMERYDDALASHDRALALQPGVAATWSDRGATLRELDRPAEAMTSFDRALAIDPQHAEAQLNRALSLLLAGEMAEGWKAYEARKRLAVPVDARAYAQPEWSGREDLRGKTLFVHVEQSLGLGDTIQFFRYVPRAVARGARVVVAVQDPLVRLLAQAQSGAEIVVRSCVPRQFDFHIPLMSLPLAFAGDIPADIPYLNADPDRIRHWQQRIGTHGLRIGIAWQGKPRVVMGGRAFPLAAARALAEVEGVRLISLQKGADDPPPGMTVESLGADFDNGPDAFLDTAAAMQALDLVVSADTSIAHLSGALGRPTWLALRHVPDWRWQMGRTDTPWYSTMRLFRQTAPGDWSNVFTAMEAELRKRVGA